MYQIDATIDATIPANGALSLTVREDTDGDGTADYTATESGITASGTYSLGRFEADFDANTYAITVEATGATDRVAAFSVDSVTLSRGSELKTLAWETETDWDNATSESGVVHESFTVHEAGRVELGYPSFDRGGSELVAYWPLDETGGDNTVDVTWNGNGGTVVGSPLDATGILGTTAAHFNGTDEYVRDGPPTTTGEITFACWMKGTPLHDGRTSKVVAGPYESSVSTTAWQIIKESGDKLTVGSYSSGNVHYATTDIAGLSDGVWYHVVGRWDGSDWDVFIDGVNETDDRVGGQGTGAVDAAGDRVIGAQHYTDDSSIQDHFDGAVDEVRLYSRSLSDAEVSDLYETASSGSLTAASQSLSDAETKTEAIVTTTASIPANTGVDLTIYEDSTGDGTADTSVTQSLDDGTQTYSFSGFSGGSATHWPELSLTTSDVTATPAVSSILLGFPAEGASVAGTTTATTSVTGWASSQNTVFGATTAHATATGYANTGIVIDMVDLAGNLNDE